MNVLGIPLLTILVFLPTAGGIFILFSKKPTDFIRYIAFSVSLANFLISILLYTFFNPQIAEPQFVERISWIKSIGVDYYLGIDGISLFLVLLTTFLTPL